MGHLLSAGIKMQGGAPATANISITNEGGLSSLVWFKNGVNQGSIANLATLNTTVNAGDTFYVRATNSSGTGATIDYSLNGSYVTSYSGSTIATTATFTAVGGNTYSFFAYAGL